MLEAGCSQIEGKDNCVAYCRPDCQLDSEMLRTLSLLKWPVVRVVEGLKLPCCLMYLYEQLIQST